MNQSATTRATKLGTDPNLVAALTRIAVAGSGTGLVSATGIVADVTLAVQQADGSMSDTNFAGPATLLQAKGIAAGDSLDRVIVAVAWRGQVHGGILVDGRSVDVIVLTTPVEVDEPVAAGRASEWLDVAALSAAAEAPSTSPSPTSPWAAIAEKSADVASHATPTFGSPAVSGDDQLRAVDDLKRQDVIIHPTFGECRVLALSDSTVRVRTSNGSPRRLSMRIFEIYQVGRSRRFELRKRQRVDRD